MKKVLILEGSPRRNGNSAILSDEFTRGEGKPGAMWKKSVLQARRLPGVLGAMPVTATAAPAYRKTI